MLQSRAPTISGRSMIKRECSRRWRQPLAAWAENHKLIDLVEQHEAQTGAKVEVAVADQKYGTQENYVACAERGITSHMGDFSQGQTDNHACRGIFPDSAFSYEAVSNTYRCPAGETLYPRRLHPVRRTMEDAARKGVCARCPLREQCTRASLGRTVKRHENQALPDVARAQAHSAAAERDRRRRRHLMEGSFADAANNHHFKRARWRRLWRQQIQDYLNHGLPKYSPPLAPWRGRASSEPLGPAGAERHSIEELLYFLAVKSTPSLALLRRPPLRRRYPNNLRYLTNGPANTQIMPFGQHALKI